MVRCWMAVKKIFLRGQKQLPPKKFFSNYLTVMRKIKSNIFPKNNQVSQKENKKTSRAMRITFALNASLCQQAENMLNSQWSQQDYTYSGLSELIRKSLRAYQEGKIVVNLIERDKNAPKREITIRFTLAPDLLNFYYSLPYSQRTANRHHWRKFSSLFGESKC